MHSKQRVVVTGAPGTGKSTVLDILENKGFRVLPEMARQLIAEEQAKQFSDCVPWLDHPSFGLELFQRQKAQYESAEAELTFYDRGIPDNLAYLRRDGVPNLQLEIAAKGFPYHPEIFLMPPWEEIYANDQVRWEDLDLMLDIDRALRSMYKGLGYQIVEVPKIDPNQRVDFILKHLGLDG